MYRSLKRVPHGIQQAVGVHSVLESMTFLSRTKPIILSLRRMSSEAKQLFWVWAPDYTDKEAPSRRMAVRAKHLEGARALEEQGILKAAGAVLVPPEVIGDAERKFVGSNLILEAKSLEDVKDVVENDIYYKENVWDKGKIIIGPYLPFKI